MNIINDVLMWLESLPAEFAFLLALPFVVAVAGLIADPPQRARRKPRPTAAPKPRARDALHPG